MVSAKQGNRRRGSGKQGNNKRFKPAAPNSNGFLNSRAINAAMFNISQMPDNPGYVDFNEPSPSIQQNLPGASVSNGGGGGVNIGGGGKINGKGRYRRSGNGGKQRNSNNNGGNRNFNGNSGMNGGGGNRRNGGQRNNNGPPMLPNRNFRNSFLPPRMGGPMGIPMMCGPPMPPPPAPIMNGGRFGPRPFMPLPALVGPMGPLRPPPMRPIPSPRNRRSIRNAPPLPGGGSNSTNGVGNGSMRRGRNLGNRKNIKNRKRGSGSGGGGASVGGGSGRSGRGKKATPTKKTLKEIVNQYSLEKPWVTEDIKSEAKIKEDIENRLKGKKDDQLFAEFKVQRDKFVTMYEAAKKEYLENNKKQKDIAKTLTESDKTNSKQDTISNETVKPAAAT